MVRVTHPRTSVLGVTPMSTCNLLMFCVLLGPINSLFCADVTYSQNVFDNKVIETEIEGKKVVFFGAEGKIYMNVALENGMGPLKVTSAGGSSAMVWFNMYDPFYGGKKQDINGTYNFETKTLEKFNFHIDSAKNGKVDLVFDINEKIKP